MTRIQYFELIHSVFQLLSALVSSALLLVMIAPATSRHDGILKLKISNPLEPRGFHIPIQSVEAKVSQGIKTVAAQASQAPSTISNIVDGTVKMADQAVKLMKQMPTGLRLGSSGAFIEQNHKWEHWTFPWLQVVMAITLVATLAPCLINLSRPLKKRLSLHVVALILRITGWFLAVGEMAVTVALVRMGSWLHEHLQAQMQHGFLYAGTIANCIILTFVLVFDVYYFFQFIIPQYSMAKRGPLTEKPAQ